ncbi:Vomeronasal type-1 receptor 3 [Sciurus carolinensis]|uniref:Vomeronasal type-1 receptor n=1 Tax=Sciurus carolinensis TaxID=30640 RepID=A0AA41MI96_SCICA|nr:vomeronasal type-1 receptor 3-like [Sciurus carolinensis]MBZ3872391.1 Vomeronasal type-1 receptor 3 [Sciurus carolinensis]
MASSYLVIGLIFFTQTVVGFLGNVFLLCHYSLLYYTGCKLRPTDLILKHLTVANSLVLLSKGVPQTMAAFGLKHFLSDIGCKVVFYVHRVGRGVCIGSICLLNVFQAITISPMTFKWPKLKLKAARYIGPSNSLCWILNMLVNSIAPIHVTGKWNSKNNTKKKDLQYCSAVVSNITRRSLYTALILSYDVLCVGLMIWASAFMVSTLYRHKKQVQHIHRTNLSPRSSPESRVTQKILILVGIFASFYTFSSIFASFTSIFHNPSWWLPIISTLFGACFPAVSPFVLMSHESRISRLS